MTGSALGNVVWLFNNLLVFVKSLAQAVQETQVDQDVDQGVLAKRGDGLAVAQVQSLDAERDSWRVDTCTCSAGASVRSTAVRWR
jgi:hypothetical protein